MSENEMAGALKLAKKELADHDFKMYGPMEQRKCRCMQCKFARALISCREPVKAVKMFGVDHYTSSCCQLRVSEGLTKFCPGCGRPLDWK